MPALTSDQIAEIRECMDGPRASYLYLYRAAENLLDTIYARDERIKELEATYAVLERLRQAEQAAGEAPIEALIKDDNDV